LDIVAMWLQTDDHYDPKRVEDGRWMRGEVASRLVCVCCKLDLGSARAIFRVLQMTIRRQTQTKKGEGRMSVANSFVFPISLL
jgi:hypothetical protein